MRDPYKVPIPGREPQPHRALAEVSAGGFSTHIRLYVSPSSRLEQRSQSIPGWENRRLEVLKFATRFPDRPQQSSNAHSAAQRFIPNHF